MMRMFHGVETRTAELGHCQTASTIRTPKLSTAAEKMVSQAMK